MRHPIVDEWRDPRGTRSVCKKQRSTIRIVYLLDDDLLALNDRSRQARVLRELLTMGSAVEVDQGCAWIQSQHLGTLYPTVKSRVCKFSCLHKPSNERL